MYHWVTDKDFVNRAYSKCADLINQLAQELRKDGFDVSASIAGSKKRGMSAQNGNKPIDFDFNLLIQNSLKMSSGEVLKNHVKEKFDFVLAKNNWGTCKDSTSVLTTKPWRFSGWKNETPFSIDLCLVTYGQNGKFERLIHDKTGDVKKDKWYWNEVKNYKGLDEREKFLKSNPEYWNAVRDSYLELRNMYLKRGDNNHPAYICYIEAVNNMYNRYKRQNNGYRNMHS